MPLDPGPSLCAACGDPTREDPCSSCGASPLLVGRFRLVGTLGQGRSGTTFRAIRVEDGAVVAVKEMPLRGADSAKARALFQREARVLRQLAHPNIPRHIEDFVAGRGKHATIFLVEELVEGMDLAREMEGRRYDEGAVLDVLLGLLPILVYLHGLSPPVIHRDLKPRNVMRRADGQLVLLDFGAVRDALVDSELGGSTVAGTFGYMAPEQFRGDATAASDLYGLGALAIALLTRREPNTLVDTTGHVRWKAHVEVSPGLSALLDRLLDREMDRRPRSAGVVLEEVRRLRAMPKTAATPEPTAPTQSPPTTTTTRPTDPFAIPPFAPPVPQSRMGLLAPNLALAAGGVSLLGFLAWTLGAFLLASSSAPPPPVPAPVTSCLPTYTDTEAPVPDTTSRFGFVGGTEDGSRVALLLGRQSDGRGELLTYHAGYEVALRERAAPPSAVRRAWEDYARAAVTPADMRAENLDPSLRPGRVAWCQDGPSVRIGKETWRFDTFPSPCALGIGETPSFQLCPPDAEDSSACILSPRLGAGCWPEAPRLVDVFRLGNATWVVAERPQEGVVARFAAGVMRE
ncbi:MAG: serine/threonine-protein kinase [Myxococcota bacterium]